jgi:hypothetical protein
MQEQSMAPAVHARAWAAGLLRGAAVLAGTTVVLMSGIPLNALAQDKVAATFEERYPGEKSAAQPAPGAERQKVATPTRAAAPRRARSRVVVAPRSFLDAGTEVLPGERKFLDYAFPPTHTPLEVVQNTGGRVGWHNSPLPGPFFPWFY